MLQPADKRTQVLLCNTSYRLEGNKSVTAHVSLYLLLYARVLLLPCTVGLLTLYLGLLPCKDWFVLHAGTQNVLTVGQQ